MMSKLICSSLVAFLSTCIAHAGVPQILLSDAAQASIEQNSCAESIVLKASEFLTQSLESQGKQSPETLLIEAVNGFNLTYVVVLGTPVADIKKLVVRLQGDPAQCSIKHIEPEITHSTEPGLTVHN